ncbi:Cof-type HAD-IIB family hydrolase [Staphylococcus felis]|uniref:Cof-type HAD-IIB family hydrolase n=1 Tax=Staphylococcus felis TaxID=46127 RepID=UPI0032DAF712
MKKYLICLDLDGTLLDDTKEIPQYTFKVLTALQNQGHILMITTGRPYRASRRYYEELNMHSPVINFNGAYIHHPLDSNFKVLHEQLDQSLSYSILETLKKMNVKNIIAEVMDCVYIDKPDPRLFDGFSVGNPKTEVGDLRYILKEDPTSILIEAEEYMIPRVKQALTRFYAENIEHRRWGAPFPVIEIVKKGISKATGIDYVRHYLDIERDAIIAFGDEDNDLEMIKYAKYGIAMGNSIDELKHVAHSCTLSNNEDGIGVYLNEFFNLNIPK